MTTKKTYRRRVHVERDVAKVISAPAGKPADEPSAGELYRRSLEQQQAWLDRDVPWRESYLNWCTHVGRAAARHNAVIEFGPGTYEAWESGVSPEQYASDRSRPL